MRYVAIFGKNFAILYTDCKVSIQNVGLPHCVSVSLVSSRTESILNCSCQRSIGMPLFNFQFFFA